MSWWPWVDDSADLSVPVAEAFDLLSCQRRLEAIRFLATMDNDEVALRELVEFVTLSVSGKDPANANDVKSIYTSLYQNHIPKLRRAGLVDVRRGTTISATEELDALHELIVTASEMRPATSPGDESGDEEAAEDVTEATGSDESAAAVEKSACTESEPNVTAVGSVN